MKTPLAPVQGANVGPKWSNKTKTNAKDCFFARSIEKFYAVSISNCMLLVSRITFMLNKRALQGLGLLVVVSSLHVCMKAQ